MCKIDCRVIHGECRLGTSLGCTPTTNPSTPNAALRKEPERFHVCCQFSKHFRISRQACASSPLFCCLWHKQQPTQPSNTRLQRVEMPTTTLGMEARLRARPWPAREVASKIVLPMSLCPPPDFMPLLPRMDPLMSALKAPLEERALLSRNWCGRMGIAMIGCSTTATERMWWLRTALEKKPERT